MIRTILIILIPLVQKPTATGYVTQFGGKDKYSGGPALCTGRHVRSTDWGIATRTGRCGDLYVVQSKHATVIVPRIDSGPWWSVPRWCLTGSFRREVYCRARYGSVMVRRRPGRTWGRNVIDATPAVMRALGLRGLGRVRVWRIR